MSATLPFRPLKLLILALAGMVAAPLQASDCSDSPKVQGQTEVERHEVTICIDPGHPSEVNSGKSVQHGTTETHIDWEIAVRLKQLLADVGYVVVMTKESEDQLVTNRDRALTGNRVNANLTVRLHCDASPGSGFAIYYPDREGHAQGKSGPSKEVMANSMRAAQAIERGMATVLKSDLKDGGVRGDSKTLIGSRQGALTGSIFSVVPVVTIEMVVLTNEHDAEYIKLDPGRTKMAAAIAAGVKRFIDAGTGAAAGRVHDH